jgi:hypothetical protein
MVGTIGDKLLWSSKSFKWHKVVNQALGWLTYFLLLSVLSTTVTDCHCQTRHSKMLNTKNGPLNAKFQKGNIEKVSTRQFGSWTIPKKRGRRF